MMYKNIENKDILLYIFNLLDKGKDKQTIFTLASCNKRINTILSIPISDNYTYTINVTNSHKIPSRYLAYRICHTLLFPQVKTLAVSLLWNRDILSGIINSLNKQVKLSTLTRLYVDDVFQYDIKNNQKIVSFSYNIYRSSDICDIIRIFLQYNIDITGMMIQNKTLKCMESFMDMLVNLQCVHIAGEYSPCNKNYTTVQQLHTEASSLYLLKNMTNIKSLTVYHTEGKTKTIDNSWSHNVTLPNLSMLSINYSCNIQLEDLLNISPNLKIVCMLLQGKRGGDLNTIQSVVMEHCNSDFIPLDELVMAEMGIENDDYCIMAISKIMYRYINNITSKYKNIKIVEILGYRYEEFDDQHHTDIIETKEFFDNVCKLTDNSLVNIFVHSYKAVCMHILLKSGNMPDGETMMSIINM